MYLQYHLRFQTKLLELSVDAYHSNLYHVGRGALNGHIDSIAFGKIASRGVAGVDVGQIASPTQKCLSITVFMGKGNIRIDVFLDIRILREILINQSCRLFAGYAQLLTKAKGTNAVHDTKIHRLGISA